MHKFAGNPSIDTGDIVDTYLRCKDGWTDAQKHGQKRAKHIVPVPTSQAAEA